MVCDQTRGRETTSTSIWQFTTSLKCSAQWFNLSPSLCNVVPSLATRINEEGFQSFLWKAQVFYLEFSWPVALQWEPGSQLLLYAQSTKIASFLNCNIGKLFEMVLLSLAIRDVLRWFILQPYPGFLLMGRVADFIGTHAQHSIPFHYSPYPHEDVWQGRIASRHCGRLWTTSILASILSGSLVA